MSPADDLGGMTSAQQLNTQHPYRLGGKGLPGVPGDSSGLPPAFTTDEGNLRFVHGVVNPASDRRCLRFFGIVLLFNLADFKRLSKSCRRFFVFSTTVAITSGVNEELLSIIRTVNRAKDIYISVDGGNRFSPATLSLSYTVDQIMCLLGDIIFLVSSLIRNPP